MKLSRFASLFLACALFAPHGASADITVTRICRGAFIPAYERMIKQDVRQKLKADGIEFKGVRVDFIQTEKRQSDLFAPDFTPNLALGGGSTPAVSYSGDFPAESLCNVNGILRIRVAYANTTTTTRTLVSVPGVLLPKKKSDDK